MACLLNTIYYSLFGPRYYPIWHIKENATAGDLIAFDRGTYRHYALYIGNGRVINIGAESMTDSSARITEESIEKVAGDSVENHDEYADYHYDKHPSHYRDILRRARSNLGHHLPYDFMFRNCEYYCTLWRFGIGFSTQVMSAKPISGSDRYDRFAKHRAKCGCLHREICHCTGEFLIGELQVVDLLLP